MKLSKFVLSTLIALLFFSCSQEHNGKSEQGSDQSTSKESADISEEAAKMVSSDSSTEAPESYISSFAAVENRIDSNRRMIRTADIKFKVKDVIKATYGMENIVVANNGFVENASLSSEINHTKTTAINADSAIVTTYFTVVNTFVLRVPNYQLDTTLKEIAQYVEYMDFRNIKATDVSIDLLSKKLEQSRLARYDSRMKNAVDNQGKKLEDISNAEENILYKQAQADEAKLINLQMLDKIKFSTINLSLYQDQRIKYEVIALEKIIQPYAEPYSLRFQKALKFGWVVIIEISLFLVNIWSLILIAILGFLGFTYFKGKYKKGE